MTGRWIVSAMPIAAGFAALLAAAPAPAAPVKATMETQHYRLELDIGANEKMYSKAEADKTKPPSGEIMVSGAMAGMPMNQAMPDGIAPRHLEVHVVSKASGKTVRDAQVSISITDAAGTQITVVPIAAMYGIQEGPEDWHYGNNVMIAPGEYRVLVTANGEQASFEVTLPAM